MNTQHNIDIIQGLRSFVHQRPGFDLRNYASMSNYRGDYNPTLQAKHDFDAMARFCELYSVGNLVKVAEGAFSGRLSIAYDPESRKTDIDYCVGQYFPTEYRNAACAVIASAIIGYWRECGYDYQAIKKQARAEFGRGAQSRWFN